MVWRLARRHRRRDPLTDADFKGAQTTDGSPFPASALKPSFASAFTWNNWRLESKGDGTYRVFSGADDRRRYLGDGRGSYFVLNLGAKRDQVEHEALQFITQSRLTTMYNAALMGGGN